ncbi:hypothetical protein MB02_06400 [Croceicoccus estronivorus]|uniref:DUF2163 domain-containing protein n=1 Tax=Croceicoccus estronivorus TaxID=1172626 RepID=UPI000829B853|nr:DUF2163 domain-containing protein [Croceicoccus estronivorus]OCC24240.1 hypothetical protein MB02_06400 [Croceicoccus estronivorus]
MSRVFFARELEATATFWRIHRRDGVTLGFTSHDRDLWFDGVLHRAAPGMVPSAIRRSAGIEADTADVRGVLAHDAIAADALAEGRFDGAGVAIGVVDWESCENAILYRGAIGAVDQEANAFSAELRSAKAALETDPVPRTSPTCRAAFCGPGCTLPASRFTHDGTVSQIDFDGNSIALTGATPASRFRDGSLRWLDGPQAGLAMEITGVTGASLVLDTQLDPALQVGARALVREGCDHTIGTCHDRFGNAVNFQGEPFLPGNDLLARYPAPQA